MATGENSTVKLGVVIPTLNAGDTIDTCLCQLGRGHDGLDVDVVISDGGSTDATVDIAMRHNVRITTAEGGRGPQLSVGAETVFGDWLLFVHADSYLPRHWPEIVRAFATAPMNVDQAAYFDVSFDDENPWARRLEKIVTWRSRALGLPYGDQALLLPRSLYESVGGYPDYPLMEDVALVRRIGGARLSRLPAAVVTSARRFQRVGYVRQLLRNFTCLSLYFLGFPPRKLKRLYG